MDELVDGLLSVAAEESSPRVVSGIATETSGGPLFVFPGLSQWRYMGRDLLATNAVFRETIEECARVLRKHVDWDLVDVIAGDSPDFDRIRVIQPALFSVMIALAKVWMSWGVIPTAVIGHSQGEVAAACASGHLSLDDAIRISLTRSALIETLPEASMLAIEGPPGLVFGHLEGTALSVLAVNGPRHVIVGGDGGEIDELSDALTADNMRFRRVDGNRISHCAFVDQVEQPLRAALADLAPLDGSIAMYSTVLAEPVAGRPLDAGYWFRNLRLGVQFWDTVRLALDAGHRKFVEISAHPVLSISLVDIFAAAGHQCVLTSSLVRERGDEGQLLAAAAKYFVEGGDIDWLHGPLSGRTWDPLDLPADSFAAGDEPVPGTVPGPADAATR
jgi:acyl transferase domain-containing protein